MGGFINWVLCKIGLPGGSQTSSSPKMFSPPCNVRGVDREVGATEVTTGDEVIKQGPDIYPVGQYAGM